MSGSLEGGLLANGFRVSPFSGNQRDWRIPPQLAYSLGSRKAPPSKGGLVAWFVSPSYSCHPAFCPLFSHTQPGRVRGMELGRPGSPSCSPLRRPTGPYSQHLAGLSKVLAPSQRWGWEEERKEEGAGDGRPYFSLEVLEDGHFLGMCAYSSTLQTFHRNFWG